MKKIVLFLTIIGMMACKTDSKNSYSIQGELTNVPDSTLIMLFTEDRTLDSVRVKDGKFNFTGSIERPTPTNIAIAYSRDAKRFWLDNSKITFTAEMSNFRNGEIGGSLLEDENELFKQRMKKFEEMEEDLQTYVEEEVDEMTETLRDSLITAMNKIERQSLLDVIAYSSENPNSLVGAYYLDFYKTSITKAEAKEAYSKLTDEIKKSYYGMQIANYLTKEEMALGVKFVDINLKDPKGIDTSLSENLGTITLIEFWAEWCMPCRENNPELVKIYNNYQSKGFEIYGVSFDRDKKQWLKALEEDKLPWTNVIDQTAIKGEVGTQYGINFLPANVLLDKDGIIIAKNLEPEELSAKLTNLLP